MIHPASRLEVVVHSRADGRSAVKSAAYTARASYRDTRLGKRFSGRAKGGLLSHELINWSGRPDDLWNAAEQAENRRDARVIRELRPSLPAELPLADQVRLVRGFSLWLRDQYGVAVQANIHAPRFKNPHLERKARARRFLRKNPEIYEAALFDKRRTNLNFHAHIMMTTREVCPETGAFGPKTRILDDRKTGPEEILRMRQEWEKRANAALKRIGSVSRVDLRSYKDMARAGDAPEGLVSQDHLGPRRAARSRRLAADGDDTSKAGRRRAEIRENNENLWASWLELRALEREKDRQLAEQLARDREVARKKKADAERRRLQDVQTAADAEVALSETTQFDSLKTDSALLEAIAWALGQQAETPCAEPEWASSSVDLETYEPPPTQRQPEPVLKPQVVRVRRRGHRHL